MNDVFKTLPAVFAVDDVYQIMVPVSTQCTMWVRVGNEEFYDESNGILRSNVSTHRMTVPSNLLDAEKSYTICYRKIIERKDYWSELDDVVETTYTFYPVPEQSCKTYHIADAHNHVDEPLEALKMYEEKFGEIDFLIMNGDVPDSSAAIKNFENIYKIAEVMKGERPIVFSRGNHDLRGVMAENLADHTPTDNGNSYFTFKLGSIFGIVVDCGEDKPDDSIEYGHTICCSAFRKRETKFLKDVMAKKEFENEKYKTRLILSHMPFTRKAKPPFNIEEDTFAEWAKILKEGFKPNLMLCGHMHGDFRISRVGSDFDYLGQPCDVVIASHCPNKSVGALGHLGCGIEFNNDGIFVTPTESVQGVMETQKI